MLRSQAVLHASFGLARAPSASTSRNIFEASELRPEAVVRNFRITAADNKLYDTQHYNLDVIISVGYRVKPLSEGAVIFLVVACSRHSVCEQVRKFFGALQRRTVVH